MFADKGEAAPFSISAIEDYPSIRIVRLRGAIESKAVAELERFRKWIANHSGFKHKHVLLDFKHVTHLDTSAVAQIIQHVTELKGAKYRLGAIHLNDQCKSMFQILKVDKLVTLYENESAAIEDIIQQTKK